MLKLSSIKRDIRREHQGDWVPYEPWPGVRFKVSAFSNPAFRHASQVAAEKMARDHKPVTEITAAEFELREHLVHEKNGELIAEFILHDWEGIDEPYTAERARDWLMDPAYEALNLAVRSCALKLAEVNAEFVKDLEKN